MSLLLNRANATVMVALCLWAWGCGTKHDSGVYGGIDSGLGSDSDADTDVDSDSDADSDTDPDTYVDIDAGPDCCNDAGQISDCWWKDAENDKVTCTTGDTANCASPKICNMTDTSRDNLGLCACYKGTDCNTGRCWNLTTDAMVDLAADVPSGQVGRCGPSYCNGFQICSCAGGCREGDYDFDLDTNPLTKYPNPQTQCEDTAAGYTGMCCEGRYPGVHTGQLHGFCCGCC